MGSLSTTVRNRTYSDMVIAGGHPWITGGVNSGSGSLIIWKSTEVMDYNNEWKQGPDLPRVLFKHCLCPVEAVLGYGYFIGSVKYGRCCQIQPILFLAMAVYHLQTVME